MAVDIYLRALEEDELAEEFYQRLMKESTYTHFHEKTRP